MLSTMVKPATWVALLAVGACGCALPLTIRRTDVTLAPAAPPACHLVLWWRDHPRAPEPKPPQDGPARAARVLLEDRSRTACGQLKTWQIARDPSKLALLAQIWRTGLPVLWAAVDHARVGEEDKRRLQLRVRARLQAGPFDTSEEPAPATEETSPGGYDASLRRLLAGLKLEPQAPALTVRRGDGPQASQAFAAAERRDWPSAAEAFAQAASARKDDLAALLSASVAAELAGDLQGAIEWHGRLLDAAQGLGGMIRIAILTAGGDGSDREVNLHGLAALRQPPLARLDRDSSVAVLPLDNETPDLDADGRARAALLESLQEAGYRPLSAADVDERLTLEGVAMAGHLKALAWEKIGKRVKADFLVAGSVEEYRALPVRQVRLRLSLIHAPSGREVLADTVEAKDAQPKPTGASDVTELAKSAAHRLSRGALRVEAKLAAEQFVGPWPHYAK